MATRKRLVHLDLNLNELQNALAHKLAADPAGVEGQLIYNTTDGCFKIYDGSSWECVRFINDAGTSNTDLWSANKIQSAIDAAVVSSVDYKGGYNAAANTPDLDTSPSGVKKGDMYTVTDAGTFFTTSVQVGDVLIAEIDSAAAEADWTIVERNLNTATETSEGTTEIATQAETDAGTDDVRYVTPLKLTTFIANKEIPAGFSVDLDGAGEASVVRAFSGGQTTFRVTHNLGTANTIIRVKEIASGETIEVDEVDVSANAVDIVFNGNVADDLYRITIIGH